MNVNQLINMITRMFIRKAMNHGVKAGVNALSSSDNAGRSKPRQKQGGGAPQNTKRAKQAMRVARRVGKF
ncbi:hypothetical protein [Shimia sp.]|uniref:hypothetical protein n=1 Tax=Shimia sp. TaxID=1954381 RepID=UPI0032975DD4